MSNGSSNPRAIVYRLDVVMCKRVVLCARVVKKQDPWETRVRKEGLCFGDDDDVLSFAYSLVLNSLPTWPPHELTGLTRHLSPVCELRSFILESNLNKTIRLLCLK